MAIEFVGANSGGVIDGNDVTIDLTALTGGIATSPAEGDLVVVTGGTQRSECDVLTSGYDNWYTWPTGVSLGHTVHAKFMGATPDTEVVCQGGSTAAYGATYTAHVYRGVDPTTPQDAAVTSFHDPEDDGEPDSPPITTVTDGTRVISAVIEGLPPVPATGVTPPSGYGNKAEAAADDSLEYTAAAADKVVETAGVEDPGHWAGFITGWYWIGATIALRPAPAPTYGEGAGSSAGTATASGPGESTAAAAGDADGAGSAGGVAGGTAAAEGDADGSATAGGSVKATAAAAGSADGAATVAAGGSGGNIAAGVGTAAGQATVQGVRGGPIGGAGTASGTSTAVASLSQRLAGAQAAAVGAQVVHPVFLAKFEFPSGSLRLWTGIGEIEVFGETYTGSGELGTFSEVRETMELEATGMAFQLSGVPQSIVALSLTEDYQDRFATLWLALLDDDGVVIDEPFPVFRGRMDVMSGDLSGDSSTVQLTVENRLIDMERPRPRRYTPEDQKELYPGDKFFDFVAGLQNKEIIWTFGGGGSGGGSERGGGGGWSGGDVR